MDRELPDQHERQIDASGTVRVHGTRFTWSRCPSDPSMFRPRESGLLRIESDSGASELFVNLRRQGESIWMGPVIATRVARGEFPRLLAGIYYVLPAWVPSKGIPITNSDVERVISRAVSGRRLCRVDRVGLVERDSPDREYWDRVNRLPRPDA